MLSSNLKLISVNSLPAVERPDGIWVLSPTHKKIYKFQNKNDAQRYVDYRKEKIYEYGPLSDANTFHLTIVLTNNCNLACQYCSLGINKMKRNINVNEIKKFLENLIQNTSFSKYIIAFFGGEPTLNKRALEIICDYCVQLSAKYKKMVSFTMATNGYFEEDVIDIICRYQFSLLYSMDGPQNIHNLQRSNSFQVVERNLKVLLNSNINLSISTVVTKYSVLYWREIAEYFKSIGVKELQFSPVFPYPWSLAYQRSNYQFLRPEPKEYIDSAFNIFKFGRVNNVTYSNFVFSRLFKPVRYYCDLNAQKQALLINYNGDILNCAEIQNVWHPLYSVSKIGNIKTTYSFSEILNNHSYKVPEKCTSCPLLYACCSGCKKRNDLYKLSYNREDNFNCIVFQELTAKLINYLANERRKANESSRN